MSCCIQKHPVTPLESCGADPLEAARILDTLKNLTKDSQTATATLATQPGDKEAAEADLTEVEQADDWTSLSELPEWKQRCIKFWNTCKSKNWTGSCTDCLRRCEGQHEWPINMCGPRR